MGNKKAWLAGVFFVLQAGGAAGAAELERLRAMGDGGPAVQAAAFTGEGAGKNGIVRGMSGSGIESRPAALKPAGLGKTKEARSVFPPSRGSGADFPSDPGGWVGEFTVGLGLIGAGLSLSLVSVAGLAFAAFAGATAAAAGFGIAAAVGLALFVIGCCVR